MSENTGYAITNENDMIPFLLPPHFSVIFTEHYAIKLAVNYYLNLALHRILTFTDSLSVLLSIENSQKGTAFYHTENRESNLIVNHSPDK